MSSYWIDELLRTAEWKTFTPELRMVLLTICQRIEAYWQTLMEEAEKNSLPKLSGKSARRGKMKKTLDDLAYLVIIAAITVMEAFHVPPSTRNYYAKELYELWGSGTAKLRVENLKNIEERCEEFRQDQGGE